MNSLNSEGLARPEMEWDGLKLHVEEWPRDEKGACYICKE